MRMNMRNAIQMTMALVCLAFFAGTVAADTSYTLKSPDDRIEVQIHVTNKIRYEVALNGKLLMKDSSLALKIGDKTLGENPQVKSAKKDSVDRVLEPVIKQKFAKIREHYNELRLEMEGGYA